MRAAVAHDQLEAVRGQTARRRQRREASATLGASPDLGGATEVGGFIFVEWDAIQVHMEDAIGPRGGPGASFRENLFWDCTIVY